MLTFKSQITLQNLNNKFLNKQFKFNMTNSSSYPMLVTYPSQLVYRIGYETVSFYMASKEAMPKFFTVAWGVQGGAPSGLSPFPLLDVVVDPDKCILNYLSSFTMYPGCRSLPIFIDAAHCLPVTFLTVTANLTNSDNAFTARDDFELDPGQNSLSKSITFADLPDKDDIQSRVFFVVTSLNASISVGTVITLNVDLAGDCAFGYAAVAPIRI